METLSVLISETLWSPRKVATKAQYLNLVRGFSWISSTLSSQNQTSEDFSPK